MLLTKILSIIMSVIVALSAFLFGWFKKGGEPDKPSPTEPTTTTTSQSGDPSDDKSWGDIHWN